MLTIRDFLGFAAALGKDTVLRAVTAADVILLLAATIAAARGVAIPVPLYAYVMFWGLGFLIAVYRRDRDHQQKIATLQQQIDESARQEDVREELMDTQTFGPIKRQFEVEGCEVTTVRRDRMYAHKLEGWREVIVPDPADPQRRIKVVFGSAITGVSDSVAMFRRRDHVAG